MIETGPKTEMTSLSTSFFPPAPDKSATHNALSYEPARPPEVLGEKKSGSRRDLVLDFLRGVAIFMMVTDHLLIVSGYSYFTRERIGVVTGAEFFVLISGVLIGHIYKQKITSLGFLVAAKVLLGRAAQLYVVCLAIVAGVFLFSLIPNVDTRLITPWGGYNLREAINVAGFFKVLTHTLMLKCGPVRMNVIGIYVVLMAGAPIAIWILHKGYARTLLVVSGLAWAINLYFQARLIGTVFDSVFRVASWQFLFVLGIVAGYYRQQIRDLIYSPRGKVLLYIMAAACVAFCLFALNNPDKDLGLAEKARLHWIPSTTYKGIYDGYFSRRVIGPGRMLNVICLFTMCYVVLQRLWKPVNRAVGWFFVTIGQASLYVYILHVFLLQALYQWEPFQGENIFVNTITTTVVLLALWYMTKRRMLFWLIPR